MTKPEFVNRIAVAVTELGLDKQSTYDGIIEAAIRHIESNGISVPPQPRAAYSNPVLATVVDIHRMSREQALSPVGVLNVLYYTERAWEYFDTQQKRVAEVPPATYTAKHSGVPHCDPR